MATYYNMQPRLELFFSLADIINDNIDILMTSDLK